MCNVISTACNANNAELRVFLCICSGSIQGIPGLRTRSKITCATLLESFATCPPVIRVRLMTILLLFSADSRERPN